ncbi:MAG: sporulation protein [Polyangiales bacterium]
MGLFDSFGVGGGSLQLQLQFQQIHAGQTLQGIAHFQSGRRAQQITNITVKLTCAMQTPQPSGQMHQQTRDISPAMQVTGPFTAQPGQNYQFPFQIIIPPDAFGSAPGLVSYRVSANADIDGEIDPGAGLDLQVIGQPYQPGMVGGMPMGKPVYGQHDVGYDPAYGKGGYDHSAEKAAYAKGGYDPGYDKGGYGKGGYDPAEEKAAYLKGGGGYDPGPGTAPYGAPKGAYGKGGGFMPGAHCMAQWSDGQYYGATVVENNGSMALVQWDDGSAPLWVRLDQMMPG